MHKSNLHSTYHVEMAFATVLFITLAILAIFYAPSLIRQSLIINEYQDFPHEPYRFSFYVVSNGKAMDPINYAYIKHDFSKDFGEISFGVEGDPVEVDWALVRLPSEVEISSIECYTQPINDYVTSVFYPNRTYPPLQVFPCLVESGNQSSFRVIFGGLQFKDTRFVIRYPLNIQPNNEYEISSIPKISGSGVSGEFILFFGEDYECFSECIFDLSNSEVNTRFSDINLKQINLNEVPNTWSSFKVITKSRLLYDDRTVRLAMGISILIGSLFSMISVGIYFIQIYIQNKRQHLNESQMSDMEDRIVRKLRQTFRNYKQKI